MDFGFHHSWNNHLTQSKGSQCNNYKVQHDWLHVHFHVMVDLLITFALTPTTRRGGFGLTLVHGSSYILMFMYVALTSWHVCMFVNTFQGVHLNQCPTHMNTPNCHTRHSMEVRNLVLQGSTIVRVCMHKINIAHGALSYIWSPKIYDYALVLILGSMLVANRQYLIVYSFWILLGRLYTWGLRFYVYYKVWHGMLAWQVIYQFTNIGPWIH